jgi:hypothetical protein
VLPWSIRRYLGVLRSAVIAQLVRNGAGNLATRPCVHVNTRHQSADALAEIESSLINCMFDFIGLTAGILCGVCFSRLKRSSSGSSTYGLSDDQLRL